MDRECLRYPHPRPAIFIEMRGVSDATYLNSKYDWFKDKVWSNRDSLYDQAK